MTDYISDLDTQRFGFKIARLENFNGNPRMIIEDFKKQGVKLVIARISTADISTINTLEDMGFEYKDIQLKYSISLVNRSQQKLNKEKSFQVRTIYYA